MKLSPAQEKMLWCACFKARRGRVSQAMKRDRDTFAVLCRLGLVERCMPDSWGIVISFRPKDTGKILHRALCERRDFKNRLGQKSAVLSGLLSGPE